MIVKLRQIHNFRCIDREMDTEKLSTFYKSRVKNPSLYTYDIDGNLVQKAKDGSTVAIIKTIKYRCPTLEESAKVLDDRAKSISIAGEKYEHEYKKLINLIHTFAPTSEIFRQNQAVEKADINLQRVRFPLKQGYYTDSVNINQVLFDERYEIRKMPYRLASMKTYPTDLQTLYVREDTGKDIATDITLLPTPHIVSNNRPVILFSRPDTNEYGFLSMQWAINFEYNSAFYTSVYQALMVEMATIYDDHKSGVSILATESPGDIVYSREHVRDVLGKVADISEESWNQNISKLLLPINRAKFASNKDLQLKLLQTGNAVLGAVDPENTFIGIGLAFENPESMNISNWTGQNVLGNVLENIRREFKDFLVGTEPARQEGVSTAEPSAMPKTVKIKRPLRKASSVISTQKDTTSYK